MTVNMNNLLQHLAGLQVSQQSQHLTIQHLEAIIASVLM